MAETKFDLYDVFLTDITPLGCVAALEQPATERFFTRSYHNGTLQYGEHSLCAEFIDFYSGNMQVLSISGEGSRMLYDAIMKQKHQRRFVLWIRTLARYVYMMMCPVIGTISFFCLFSGQWLKVLLGFIMLVAVRLIYVGARNYIR